MNLRYVLSLLLLLSASAAQAQVTIACQSAASDADGDGFGFENGQSCRVDISSANAPEFVNQRTGQPVILERPFWNAEDFLEPIVCQNFYFDGIDYQVSASAVLMDFCYE